jgi:tetratricopeptide (TPR) repeat protein
LLLLAESTQASLYAPDDTRISLPTEADGKPIPLKCVELLDLLTDYTNALDQRKKDDGKVNSYRQRFLDLIAKSKPNASPDETAAVAGYMMRIGEQDKAIALLRPHTHDRRPNYFVFQTLSHIYADMGDWREALHYYQEGKGLDTEMPSTIKGLTDAQRNWWDKLDRDYLPLYYKISPKETEDVLPLFPVRFVNDAGVYQPGQLAVSERAKLPEDAIAIVQQFLIWFPRDARLYWLLAELYAASGQFRDAAELFGRCAGTLQYSKHKTMMEHRAAVQPLAAKEKPPEETPLLQPATPDPETPQPPSTPINMKTIWYYFGAIGLVALFAMGRSIIRRKRQSGAVS